MVGTQGGQTATPPGHPDGVAPCTAHTAGDMGLKMWLGRSVGDDKRVHHHHSDGEVVHERGSGSRDRAGGNRLLDHPAWEGQKRIDQGNLAENQPD